MHDPDGSRDSSNIVGFHEDNSYNDFVNYPPGFVTVSMRRRDYYSNSGEVESQRAYGVCR